MKNEISGKTVRFSKNVDVHLLIKNVRCSYCGEDYDFNVALDEDNDLSINVCPHTCKSKGEGDERS